MLEMGPESAEIHPADGEQAEEMGVGRLFTYGPHGSDTIAGARAAGLTEAAAFDGHAVLAESIRQAVRPGDVLLVKGSRGMRMETVIEALRIAEAQHTD
jgi:UDP-N-acetylmuramoyl-tripeptide--D-alanyl-D-alanine ligase